MSLAVIHEPRGPRLPDHLFGERADARIARADRHLEGLAVGLTLTKRVEIGLLRHREQVSEDPLARDHGRHRDGEGALGLVMRVDRRLLAALLERAVDRRLGRRELVDDDARAVRTLLEELLDGGAVSPGKHAVEVRY